MDQTVAPPAIKHNVAVDFGVIALTGTLHHDDARRALVLLTDEGPERISVNLEAYGLVAEPGRVFVKDWSEHVGLAERLQQAGLVRIVRSVAVGPFASTAHEVEVTL
ncbi:MULTISPECIES: hypothetical protein [Paenarthrobacter]|uniref:Uncharacterized protein n=1 Tax=Paenarthrobacter ureafaciens TaxID=37931 RepID=A0AAX3EFW4_PAEUR|nr:MULTISPECIES: hypothetical protein [Paenarthrobacter]NKR13252.1 hypothetical protein [Arthrobacter sp. M5]NKR14898.1 hypothetical protein [Arthrobacter sp. M6]OEH62450.1 hypothetical protein A5N13_01980 [Arthrobacter sp. D4]OEH63021.1 hypothetical protein A5N17_10220 [Arthrobacter sp. D2]MDO5865201.1 hypothetical protein [Paenarthrobacter sp. SD-2]